MGITVEKYDVEVPVGELDIGDVFIWKGDAYQKVCWQDGFIPSYVKLRNGIIVNILGGEMVREVKCRLIYEEV